MNSLDNTARGSCCSRGCAVCRQWGDGPHDGSCCSRKICIGEEKYTLVLKAREKLGLSTERAELKALKDRELAKALEDKAKAYAEKKRIVAKMMAERAAAEKKRQAEAKLREELEARPRTRVKHIPQKTAKPAHEKVKHVNKA